MAQDAAALARYYGNGYGEENRFSLDRAHRVEFLTTMHLLQKHLPRRCSVLDCCAGTGAYAFPLSFAGFSVTAGDLLQLHVEKLLAQNQNGQLESVYQGDALDLSRFSDGQFDAVLCLGALYHLADAEDRLQCVTECLRVLKNGGVFAFSYINRYAVFANHVCHRLSDVQNWRAVLETGQNDPFYAMDFGEAQALAQSVGLAKITDAATDALGFLLGDAINEADDAEFSAYCHTHLACCEQPSILGCSMHGLYIGQKGSTSKA